jgi:hypothetical protein
VSVANGTACCLGSSQYCLGAKAFKRMPSKGFTDVDVLSIDYVRDSEESVGADCAPSLSSERSTVPSWETEVKTAVRHLQDQHTGTPGRSLYLEMRARREGLLDSVHGGTNNLNRKHLGRCIRAPWCAFTLLFWSYDHLAKRLRVLPGKLKTGMSCWVWVAHESKALWPGCDQVATCVVLFGGVPASFTVRRMAELLLSSEGKPLGTDAECSPGWWLHAMAGKAGVDDWLSRHELVLRQVNYVAQTCRESRVDKPGGINPGKSVGKTQVSVGRRRPTNVVVDVARQRKPLGEVSGNTATR